MDYVAGMTVRPIHILPDAVLRQRAEEVAEITDEVRTLIADMFDTMYAADGIGLAAPQVGVLKRVVVIDLAHKDESAKPEAYINPEIVWSSEETSDYDEGCLSIPDYYENVVRPARVRVKYLDREGVAREVEAAGVLATCLQHEIDHLNGVLFIDYLSKLKRDRVVTKFTKAAKRNGGKPRLPQRLSETPEPDHQL